METKNLNYKCLINLSVKLFHRCCCRILFVFAFAMMFGCSDNNQATEPNASNEPSIKFSDNTTPAPALAEEGGDTQLDFVASKPWKASLINTRSDSWLKIHPTSGDAGNAAITISAETNETYDDRSATLVITAGDCQKSVVVTQKRKDAIILTSSKKEVDASGGTINIDIKANVNYTCDIDPVCESWVHRSAITRGLTDYSETFTIDTNNDLESREGAIYFVSGNLKEKVSVYQQGSHPKIVISRAEETVSADGGNLTIEIASNVNVELKPVAETWIRENSTRSYSTNTFIFVVDRNDTYDYREAVLTFINKENELEESVKVVQMPKNALVIAKSEYQLPLEANILCIEAQAAVKPSVAIPQEATWIKLREQSSTRAIEPHDFVFDVEKNDGAASRMTTITFTSGSLSQNIDIRQEGSDDVLQREKAILLELRDSLTINGKDFEMVGWDYSQRPWTDTNPVTNWIGVEWENGHVVGIRVPEYKSNLAARVYHTGKIPKSIGGLKYLRKLIVSDNNLGMTAPIPAEIGNLDLLEELTIHACNIPGGIPSEIGNLSRLKSLMLRNVYTNEIGYLPEKVFSSTDIPESLGNLTNLSVLHILWNIKSGIPSSFGNLDKLETLWMINETREELSGTKFAEDTPIGAMPNSIGRMKKLKELDLRMGISGELPYSFGDLSSMESLCISSAFLTGALPASISKMTALRSLYINTPKMTGEIPSSIGELKKLKYLSLEGGFTGAIPESLGNCKELHSLFLKANFTSFPGSLSFILDNRNNCCTNNDVGLFKIGGNRFTGKIPDEILNHPNFYLFAPNFLDAQQEGYGFDLTDFKMPACKDTYKEVYTGKDVKLGDVYKNNKLTIIFRYSSYYDYSGDGKTKRMAEIINRLYEKYKEQGLDVICSYVGTNDGDKALSSEIGTNNYLHVREQGYDNLLYNATIGCTFTTPTIGVVDSEGFYQLLNALDSQLGCDRKFADKYHVFIGDFESRVAKLMFE
ncbi:MAG: BACON domain-containing protein [Prevotella sp.]